MIGNLDGFNNDYISGWAFDPLQPERRVKVDIIYNGKHLTGATAGFSRAELMSNGVGDGHHGFFVALPKITKPEWAEVKVVESLSGQAIGQSVKINRTPTVTPGGISSVEALGMLSTPLFSVEGFDLTGPHPTLNLLGFHLPPDGDPFLLQIKGQPGVVFTVQYPILRHEIPDWYWFWPNAAWCGFKISIDLVASTFKGPDFQFTFESPGAKATRGQHNLNRIYMPKDLSALQNFPTGDHLTRVHNFDTPTRVAMTGYTDFRRFQSLAAHYGMDLSDRAVLDWGCGHGRVIRFFEQYKAARESWGVDIDKENIAWLSENLPGVKARVAPLMPPSDLPAGHFDLIYAISVMTHLRRDVQEAWLRELKRVAKPGALIMLTFAGRGAAAFSSRHLSKKWLERFKRDGFDATLGSPDLLGKIDDPSYYINTTQTPEDVRAYWGQHFDILDIHECAFGYQDLAVMRVKAVGSKSKVTKLIPAKKAASTHKPKIVASARKKAAVLQKARRR